jgi:hypothetical protein
VQDLKYTRDKNSTEKGKEKKADRESEKFQVNKKGEMVEKEDKSKTDKDGDESEKDQVSAKERWDPFQNQVSPATKRMPWSSKIRGIGPKRSITEKMDQITEKKTWLGDQDLVPDVLRPIKKELLSPRGEEEEEEEESEKEERGGEEEREEKEQDSENIRTITIRERPTFGRPGDSQETSSDLTTYTVQQLKDMCREQGLPTNGKKADLVSRLS